LNADDAPSDASSPSAIFSAAPLNFKNLKSAVRAVTITLV
jgi:hypothetical protein